MLDNLLDVLVSLGLPLLDVVPLLLDASNLSVLLRLLVFVLLLEKRDTLLKMNFNRAVNLLFSGDNATEAIDLLLERGLLFLMQAILARLGAL